MATLEVELKPFSLPNFVLVEASTNADKSVSIHLSEVPRETLIQMCEDFKDAVLEKAGYTDGN